LKQKDGVFSDYFTNEEPRCPATTCTLKKIACTEALESVEDSHIAIDDKELHFERNFHSGYETDFCLSCSNGYMTSTADNLSVYQEGSTPFISLILSILFIVVAIVGGGTLIYIGNENLKAKHAKKLQKVG